MPPTPGTVVLTRPQRTKTDTQTNNKTPYPNQSTNLTNKKNHLSTFTFIVNFLCRIIVRTKKLLKSRPYSIFSCANTDQTHYNIYLASEVSFVSKATALSTNAFRNLEPVLDRVAGEKFTLSMRKSWRCLAEMKKEFYGVSDVLSFLFFKLLS